MKAAMEEAPVESPVKGAGKELPSDELIRSKWPELAKMFADKPRLANMLSSTVIDITSTSDAKTVTFQVVNEAQKTWVESKLLYELEGKFRTLVESVNVYVRVSVRPDDTPQERIVYMPSEQAKELMEANDEVKSLVTDLGLDIK